MSNVLVVLAAAALLGGCATPRYQWFENRIACTVDGTQAHALSMWGLFSIGSRIAAGDAAAVCDVRAAGRGKEERQP